MAGRVRLTTLACTPSTIGGVDAAYANGQTVAAAVVYDYPALTLREEVVAALPTTFPYVPGYLSFREGPAILAAINKLTTLPDLFIVDGQGIAHPRGIGIATFLGVLLGRPTIGSAKSRLVGTYDEPPDLRGSWTPLIYRERTVGAILRTRQGVKPLFISPGHLVTVDEAVVIVLDCCTRYRLPEPQREADHLVGVKKREFPLLDELTAPQGL
ncbi:MAG: endonuclease V [Geobacter sp.]|nr:MAG: endonuclease V [Geobacter sp.]